MPKPARRRGARIEAVFTEFVLSVELGLQRVYQVTGEHGIAAVTGVRGMLVLRRMATVTMLPPRHRDAPAQSASPGSCVPISRQIPLF